MTEGLTLLRGASRIWVEQIKDFLVVDLQKRYEHAVVASSVILPGPFNMIEKLLHTALGHTHIAALLTTLHGVGLSRASLPIGKDSAVIALQNKPKKHLRQSPSRSVL